MAASPREIVAAFTVRPRNLFLDKLHVLMFYAQGHHLADVGEPLFDSRILAGETGPIVEGLLGQGTPPADDAWRSLGDGALNTVGYVLSRYGGLTDRDLRRLARSEDPWLAARARTAAPTDLPEISHEALRTHFAADPGDLDEVALAVLGSPAARSWLAGAGDRIPPAPRRDDPAELAARIRRPA